jgi:dihydroceramidase
MVVAGIAGVVLHWTAPVERRFAVAFALVALLGVGSVMFHASLKWWGQMLDEVPMLWAALTTTYIMLEDGPSRNGKYGPCVVLSSSLFAAPNRFSGNPTTIRKQRSLLRPLSAPVRM